MARASGLVKADRRFRQGVVIGISDGADRCERAGVEKPAGLADRDIRCAQLSSGGRLGVLAGRGEGGGLVVGVVRGQAMVEAAEEPAEDSRTGSNTLFPGKLRMSEPDVGAEAPNFLLYTRLLPLVGR